MILVLIASAMIGSVFGIMGMEVIYALTPKYKPGTPVRWRYPEDIRGDDGYDGWNTGIYLCRSAIGYHKVRATGPLWWSAARNQEEVTVPTKAEWSTD